MAYLYSRVIIRKAKITHKDLSKEKIYGSAIKEDFEIEIDPNQSAKEYLNTFLHEYFHCILPKLSEKSITSLSNLLSKELWNHGFRKIQK